MIRLGEDYWVLTDLEHSYSLGEIEFNAIKHCNFRHLSEEDDRIRYCFYPNNMDETNLHEDSYYELDEWEVEQLVFQTVDEYLCYLVTHVDNLNSVIPDIGNVKKNGVSHYGFDDFLKAKIEKSQEDFPEIWI